ncbi:MAG: cytochrome D ubiquinol oxidase subunit II [candidate division NC10 bacterium RIFCSPLOWO2_02_FULL_66_22]|nr:MAG: cytochrome D ubiquinol oxidase subunit II [candidate division NC10 bacterium RIFCSPLOWO2_02_FULL_66_22]
MAPSGSGEVGELIDRLVKAVGGSPHAEFLHEMVQTVLRLIEDQADRGDVKIMNAALRELVHAFRLFTPYRGIRKVTIFGSARTTEDQPEYRQALAFAHEISRLGWMVITGAGDGIMKAGQGGAGRERSFGVNIRLPFDQPANEFIQNDSKLITFKYFFTRKLIFVKETDAIALFPGGFGTLDEAFEILTLIQTGKSNPLPVVCVDRPGGDYWRTWDTYVRNVLLARGLIAPQDLCLYRVTDRLDEAIAEVSGFYRNYHSSRYVGDRLVIRLQRAPTAEDLDRLNRQFHEILVDGAMTVSPALPEEGNEDPISDLPRLVLHFNRRDVGRLRQLIDALNQLPTAPPAA